MFLEQYLVGKLKTQYISSPLEFCFYWLLFQYKVWQHMSDISNTSIANLWTTMWGQKTQIAGDTQYRQKGNCKENAKIGRSVSVAVSCRYGWSTGNKVKRPPFSSSFSSSFGTNGQRSIQSAFWRSTGNEVRLLFSFLLPPPPPPPFFLFIATFSYRRSAWFQKHRVKAPNKSCAHSVHQL